MAKFKVIKAHDGVKEGETRTLPQSPVTDYMVKNGYWIEVKERPAKQARTTKATGR